MKKNKILCMILSLLFPWTVAQGQSLPNHSIVGQDLDAIVPVGQFIVGNGSNLINAPFSDTNWWNILSMRHGNPSNNFVTQIAGEFFGPRLAFRNTNSSANRPWNEIYHSGNLPTLKSALNLPDAYVGRVGNLGVNLNDHAYASSMGKLFNGSNAPVTYGQFLSFGEGQYSTQFNSQHFANGQTYIRVNGDAGVGNWNVLYHSGMTAQIKTDLALNLQDVVGSGHFISKDVSSIEPDFIRMKNTQPNANTLGLGVHGANGYAYIQSSKEGVTYDNPIALQPNGGNVGIGTTSPQEKLSVNGKIRAREVKVEAANWPDYVFDEDYRLASLVEIEEFIIKNKHLPDVPSAQNVNEKGIELGEMNKILLKKVEELTLLLIEKDKELKHERLVNDQQTIDIKKLYELVNTKK